MLAAQVLGYRTSRLNSGPNSKFGAVQSPGIPLVKPGITNKQRCNTISLDLVRLPGVSSSGALHIFGSLLDPIDKMGAGSIQSKLKIYSNWLHRFVVKGTAGLMIIFSQNLFLGIFG